MTRPDFRTWLRRHRDRLDDIGDLARLAHVNSRWPTSSDQLDNQLAAVRRGGSQRAFAQAWALYTDEFPTMTRSADRWSEQDRPNP